MIRLLPAVLAIWSTACFDPRSDDYTCGPAGECAAGRVCQQGWCVVAAAIIDSAPPDSYVPPYDGAPDAIPPPDAPPLPDAGIADAFVCPPQCTDCVTAPCHIDCAVTGACPTLVVCPPGLQCKVECGPSACLAGIDCSAASSCIIECSGDGSCAGPITCGAGRCRAECGGAPSCTGGIDCATACQCDTFCIGVGSCAPEPLCPGPAQCDNGTDCTSVPGPCNTC